MEDRTHPEDMMLGEVARRIAADHWGPWTVHPPGIEGGDQFGYANLHPMQTLIENSSRIKIEFNIDSLSGNIID